MAFSLSSGNGLTDGKYYEGLRRKFGDEMNG